MKKIHNVEELQEKNTNKKAILWMGMLILMGIVTLLGSSYALFSTTLHGEKKVSIQTGTFEVEMTDGEYIKEENLGTMTDKEGKKTKPYTFTITNTSTETIGAYYKLYLTEESGNLNTYYLKYELKGNDGSQKEGRIETLSSFYINKYLEAKKSVTYELRLWLDEETPNSEQGKNYQSKIAVEGSQVKFPTAAETLLTNYTNNENEEFDVENKDNPVNHKMFVFHHEETEQQKGWSSEELTDYRYIGADPNNYVTFNGEEAGWRIIGIFTVENEKGEKEKRIKLIHNVGIGKVAWDQANTNDWANASLMKAINPDTGETTYNWTAEAKKMIGDTKWYLGGIADYTSASNGLASHFYGYERGTSVFDRNPTYWIGKVGLMYPSDYGYATSGGNTTNQDACLAKPIYNWQNEDVSDCKNNDWIYKSLNSIDQNKYQWTLSPYSSLSNHVFLVYQNGFVGCDFANRSGFIGRPVIYLSSTISYAKGTGSQEDPFVFSE